MRGAAFRSTCARISVWDTSRCRQVLMGCDVALRSDGGAHRSTFHFWKSAAGVWGGRGDGGVGRRVGGSLGVEVVGET